nr:MAG TPA: hypothetical protein [Caudoviricetes sp.]
MEYTKNELKKKISSLKNYLCFKKKCKLKKYKIINQAVSHYKKKRLNINNIQIRF